MRYLRWIIAGVFWEWSWVVGLVIWVIEILIALVWIKYWDVNSLFLFFLGDFRSITLSILWINYRWIQIAKIIRLYNFFHDPNLISHLLCPLRYASNPAFPYTLNPTFLIYHFFISILILPFHLVHMLFKLIHFILHLSVEYLLPFDPLGILEHLRR